MAAVQPYRGYYLIMRSAGALPHQVFGWRPAGFGRAPGKRASASQSDKKTATNGSNRVLLHAVRTDNSIQIHFLVSAYFSW